jgi:hypothetical protein
MRMVLAMRPPHDSLGALLASLVPLAFAAGCSSPIGEFDQQVCVTGGADAIDDLLPAEDVDYVELRSGYSGSPPVVQARWGEPCDTASDEAACAAALEALVLEPLFRVGVDAVTDYGLAYTRADEVDGVATFGALLELLATIDTPTEAALVAHAQGHDMPCGRNNVRASRGGFVVLGTKGTGCGDDVEHYEISVAGDGRIVVGETEIVEHGQENCVIGRRPDALRSRPRRSRSVGEFFANAAELEAASVHAFVELAIELRAHGAPRRLTRAALRSARDEVRHARVTAGLARRYGGVASAPVVGAPRVRSLYEVALDNAAEGCVRETFGALVAHVQARSSCDPVVRRALERIAVDETRHASLSWALDGWVTSRLPRAERRRLGEARRAAVATLRADVARASHADVTNIAGVPGPETSLRLVNALDRRLWQRA